MALRLLCIYLVIFYCPTEQQMMSIEMNVAQMWGKETLRLIGLTLSKFSPPTVARTLAIVSDCMYDATVPYNQYQNSVSGVEIAKRPIAERNDMNFDIAVSYGAFRALAHIFQDFPQYLTVTRSIMTGMGLNPDDMSEFLFTPQGVGNRACRELLNIKDRDGWNFLGNADGTISVGTRYADYTNYVSRNDPQTRTGLTDCSILRDKNSWQPLKIQTAVANVTAIQKWAGNNAFKVKTFSGIVIEDISLQGPAYFNSNSNSDAVTQNGMVLNISANLGDKYKIIAEYWADGPGTTNPPGHWYNIAINISIERGMSLTRTVNMLFLLSNAVHDAGIIAWTGKRMLDTVRPITGIQCLYANNTVIAWGGPYKGVRLINGSSWQPYQSPTFVTPAFAEWPSGHAAFSYASSSVLKQFFDGDEDFGHYFTVTAGNSQFEPKIKPGHAGYIAGITDVPNTGYNTVGFSPAKDVTMYWDKFSSAAQCSTISRIYGGIHYVRGANDGMAIGLAVGDEAWKRYIDLLGTERDEYVH